VHFWSRVSLPNSRLKAAIAPDLLYKFVQVKPFKW
jgi:hypothetical protein